MIRSSRNAATVLSLIVAVSATFLAWSGYLATVKWRQASALLAEREAQHTADRFVLALIRDMEGAQRRVLSAEDTQGFAGALPYSSTARAASAFARVPYLESLFVWGSDSSPADIQFFNRRERQPPWMPPNTGPDRFSVVASSDATVSRQLLTRIRLDADQGRLFSVFDVPLGETPYQIVARLIYSDVLHQRLDQVIGFTVNLQWVRQYYFSDLVQQLQQLDGGDAEVALAVTDDQGQLVAGSHASMSNSETRRRFSLMFFDPLSVIGHLPVDIPRDSWTVEATPSHEPRLADAIRGVNLLLIFSALAWVTLIFGLVLTVRAATTRVELATLRSEFVSSVSHELKAPLATIRAAGDLLVAGRVADEAGRRDYARIMVQEAKRLTRLVDNLLAVSRVGDVTTVYSFEPFAIDVLVEAALQRLRVQLLGAEFSVAVNVPSDLPPISADRDAILLMLENLLDNAIRYSGTTRRLLEINGRLINKMVVLELRDFGRGIPDQDINHVTTRFYRASNAEASGTGIGLAIAKRIVIDHGGTLEITSTLGVGTTVRVALPVLLIHEESARRVAS